MTTRWETYPIEIAGGLIKNLSDINHGLKVPGSAINLINFEPSTQGGLRRINGYEKFDTNVVPSADTATPLLGVGFFDGDVLVPREGKVYSSSGSGWTEIATGRTQTTKTRFTIFNFDGTRKIVAVDGVNYPWTWDKSSFVNLTGSSDIQGASHVIEFKDHLFFSKGSLITFTVPFDETSYSVADGAGNFRVESDVTGMIVFRERLFIFSSDKIHVLDGDSVTDFSLTSVSEKIGCVRTDTIQQVSGDVAFLAADGVRLLGATDRLGDFSNLIASSQIQADVVDFLNSFENYSSMVVRGKSQYRVLGTSSGLSRVNCGGYLGTQFEPQNPQSFQWGELKELKVYASDSQVYDGAEYIVTIDAEEEYVYRMEMGPDFDGEIIKSSFWTPYISFTDTLKRKTFYKVDTFIVSESDTEGTLTLSIDQGTYKKPQPTPQVLSSAAMPPLWDDFEWGSSDWGTGDPSSRISTVLQGSGFTASIQYDFNNSSSPFVIDTIFVEFSEEDRK